MNTQTIINAAKPKFTVSPPAKRLIVHALAFATCFGLAGWLCSLFDDFIEILSLQLMVVMVLLGSIHWWALYQYHDWANEDNWRMEALFTCAVNLLGGLTFFMVTLKAGLGDYALCLLGITSLFSLPFIVDKSMAFHIAIPAKTYPPFIIKDEWAAKASMAFEESGVGVIWRFEDDGTGNLPPEDERIFAPGNLNEIHFGSLFGAYLLWHNTRVRPDQPIQVSYQDDAGNTCYYRWEFYHRRHWYSLWQSRIDPSLTVGENRLRFKRWKSKLDEKLLVSAPLIFVKRIER